MSLVWGQWFSLLHVSENRSMIVLPGLRRHCQSSFVPVSVQGQLCRGMFLPGWTLGSDYAWTSLPIWTKGLKRWESFASIECTEGKGSY